MWTFLFADLAGFTALTETHGDEDAISVVTRFYDLVRISLVNEARLVKTIGDAVMIITEQAPAAVLTALKIVGSVRSESGFPAVRVGLHSGPAIERDGDYFGATVNLAARITAYARSEQILCTEVVAESVRSLKITLIRSAGIVNFKNVSEPTALFQIMDFLQDTIRQDIDPVCRMRIDPDTAPARLPFQTDLYHFCSFACAQKFAQAPEAYIGNNG